MTILEEAQAIVKGARAEDYGPAVESYQRLVKAFWALTGVRMTAAQAAVFMILLKLDREMQNPKRDNRVDGAGYFEILDQIQAQRPEAKVARFSYDAPFDSGIDSVRRSSFEFSLGDK